jgi:hypothetical protein
MRRAGNCPTAFRTRGSKPCDRGYSKNRGKLRRCICNASQNWTEIAAQSKKIVAKTLRMSSEKYEGPADERVKETIMASIASAGSSISITKTYNHRVKPGAIVSVRRSRKLSREAGRAIEMLGHAIDYLADEFALDCMSISRSRNSGPNPRMAAIELLMACNREIYLSCPEIPSFSERFSRKFRSIFRIQGA